MNGAAVMVLLLFVNGLGALAVASYPWNHVAGIEITPHHRRAFGLFGTFFYLVALMWWSDLWVGTR